MPLWLRNYRKY